MDGVGEWATSTIGVGRGRELTILKEMRFPHSLGLLYSAFTYLTGFRVNSGEYKLMGLAPYGQPTYVDRILETYFSVAPRGLQSFMMAVPLWLKQKLWIPMEIEATLESLGFAHGIPVYYPEHHE